MNRFILLLALCLFPPVSTLADDESGLHIIVIVGAPGTNEYQEVFSEVVAQWKQAANRGRASIEVIGLDPAKTLEAATRPSDAELLQDAIAGATSPELWLVMIGHGTFDSRTVKFNAKGPDFTDSELASWLLEYEGELALINTTSASGSFIPQLSKPGRTVITATKNELEMNYARFGRYFAKAIGGLPEADLDNDDQVSLLESFLYAGSEVAKFYEGERRIATEHALLDDNGDKMGSRSEWYEGTTPTQTPSKDLEPDGERASQKVLVKNEFERLLTPQQRLQRDELERQVKQLRRKRDSLEEQDYYDQLEPLLIQLARLYDQANDS